MTTPIKCPHCANEFDVQNVLSADVEQKIKQQYEKQLQQSLAHISTEKKKLEDEQRLFDEKRKKENELFQQKVQQEMVKKELEIKQQLQKSISSDFENQLLILTRNAEDIEEKLKLARKKELEYLDKEQALKNKEAELELQAKRTLQQERNKLTEEIRKIEQQKMESKENEMLMRQRELEKQLEDQKKLAEEMKRKHEQGSMQLQGEVQELKLQDMLKAAFPFDVVCEVAKGSRGADCLLTIRNNYGQECGKIIFESKRTQAFASDWIEKLKADKISTGADLAVLVTQAMPRDLERFGDRDGIWVCSYLEAKALVSVLRDGVIRIFNATRKQENKGDKMHFLYDYLTSHEFAGQWKAVREGFLSMRDSIQRERDMMEKLWKSREKQLEKVLMNTAYIKGSIEGIAGQDTIDLNLTEEDDEEETPKLMFK